MVTATHSQETSVNSNWRSDVGKLLQQGVDVQAFPGAVFEVYQGGTCIVSECAGTRAFVVAEEVQPLLSRDTVYDVAGITAGVITTTMIMKLAEAGKLKLEDRVSRYVQGFGVNGKSAITIQDLLAHTSGLAAWVPFFEELVRLNAGSRMGMLTSRGAKEYVYNVINRSSLKYQPRTRQLYSDIGLIVLGEVVEILTGLSLDKAAQKMILQPLGLKGTSFIDLTMVKRHGIHPVLDLIAPTEDCAWRKRVLCGEVHDDNAWAMGGVAGHSGLFTMARDLGAFAVELLKCYRGAGTFLRKQTVKGFWARPDAHFELTHTLGWELPNRDNGFLEVGFSDQAVGITAFTGCTLFLEPERDLALVLMTNRIHPSRSNRKIVAFRQELFRTVLTSARA
jgi:CubicO group peptidase (beta-lactamase class C family)